MTEKDPDNLSLDDIERIEKLTLRWIFQAVLDFGMEAHEIFLNGCGRWHLVGWQECSDIERRLQGKSEF